MYNTWQQSSFFLLTQPCNLSQPSADTAACMKGNMNIKGSVFAFEKPLTALHTGQCWHKSISTKSYCFTNLINGLILWKKKTRGNDTNASDYDFFFKFKLIWFISLSNELLECLFPFLAHSDCSYDPYEPTCRNIRCWFFKKKCHL